MKKLFITLLILFWPSLGLATTYHYLNCELGTGDNDGSSWANAWQDWQEIVDDGGWAAMQSEAASQPVYLYIKKGTTCAAADFPSSGDGIRITGSGSSDTNRIFITVDPADSGAKPIIDPDDAEQYGFDVRCNYVTFNGLHVRDTTNVGINQYSVQANYINIEDCEIDNNFRHGIYAGDSTGATEPTYPHGHHWIVTRNYIHNNGDVSHTNMDHGIYTRYCDNWTVEYNKITDNVYGYAVNPASDADDWIIRYNYFENNGTSPNSGGDRGGGINVNGQGGLDCDNIKIYYNVMNNNYRGIYFNTDDGDGSGQVIIGNTIYDCQQSALTFCCTGDVPTGPDVYNNIIWTAVNYLWVLYDDTEVHASNNNNIGPAANDYIQYQAGYYDNLNEFIAGIGGANEISSDPLFTNAAGGDFTLQAGSLCIGAGEDLGNGLYYGLDPTSTWPDNVKLLNQDDYGAWEIGAYVYIVAGPSGGPGTIVGGGSGTIAGGGSGTIVGTTPE